MTVSDRDQRYDEHGDEEYHFSDEHEQYEVEPESTNKVDAVNAAIAVPPSAGVAKYRKTIIIVSVLVGFFIVVKMLKTPSSLSTPPTSIVPQSAVSQPKAKSGAASAGMSVSPLQQQTIQSTQLSTSSPPMSEVTSSPQMITVAPSQAGNITPEMGKEMMDKITSLEQQNAKLTNTLQIDYAQKMSDYENQSVALQAKLKELNARVASMEATLNQITQMLQGNNTTKPIMGSSALAVREMEASNKPTYTVQAIIPGRAWLKSDVGDTVTVAEGDVLKDYGRITKIDPYNGVVDIDTGAKTVSLSYGTGGD